MANSGRRLISKVLMEQSLSLPLERGISTDYFPDTDSRRVWDFLIQHFTKYQDVPSAATVKKNYPTYKLLNVSETVDFLVDEVVKERKDRMAYAMLQDAVSHVGEQKFDAALDVLRAGLLSLDSVGINYSSSVDLTLNPEERLNEYLARRTNNGMIGIPTGFPTIDKATSGLQPEQLTTCVAGPKAGKSTLKMKIAIHVHSLGHSVMFQSFEMSNTEQKERHDAMRAKVALSRVRNGHLTSEDEKALKQMYADMKGLPAFTLEDASEGMTVSSLASKVARIKPDVLFVDGVYLMRDEVTGESGTPQAITNITRALKRLAQVSKIPVVISTQTLLWKMKGKKTSAEAIGYSSSFVQDSDVVLGLDMEEDREDERTLKIIASRNSSLATVGVRWDWRNGSFREFGANEMNEVSEEMLEEELGQSYWSSGEDVTYQWDD